MSIYSNTQQRIAVDLSSQDKVAASKWMDWRWQLKHAITQVETFERILDIQLEPMEKRKVELTLEKFPMLITPYYLSLIDRDDYRNDPIYRQAFPDPQELEIDNCDMIDPLSENRDSPADGITHSYPDRVIFHVSNVCSMYCRHCTRKRKVGDIDSIPGQNQVRVGLDYIRNTPEISDVLLSGGDPFMLNDAYLDWILTELRQIEHVQTIRIDSRMPVTLPYRITDELVEMLRKHQQVLLKTHFNHPREITSSSRNALRKMSDAGIPLGNQSVLLEGVNDCQRIIKSLAHKLVESRVRPYSIYQCGLSEGISHFRTPVGKGVEIMEGLIGHTNGFAVPT